MDGKLEKGIRIQSLTYRDKIMHSIATERIERQKHLDECHIELRRLREERANQEIKIIQLQCDEQAMMSKYRILMGEHNRVEQVINEYKTYDVPSVSHNNGTQYLNRSAGVGHTAIYSHTVDTVRSAAYCKYDQHKELVLNDPVRREVNNRSDVSPRIITSQVTVSSVPVVTPRTVVCNEEVQVQVPVGSSQRAVSNDNIHTSGNSDGNTSHAVSHGMVGNTIRSSEITYDGQIYQQKQRDSVSIDNTAQPLSNGSVQFKKNGYRSGTSNAQLMGNPVSSNVSYVHQPVVGNHDMSDNAQLTGNHVSNVSFVHRPMAGNHGMYDNSLGRDQSEVTDRVYHNDYSNRSQRTSRQRGQQKRYDNNGFNRSGIDFTRNRNHSYNRSQQSSFNTRNPGGASCMTSLVPMLEGKNADIGSFLKEGRGPRGLGI